MDTVMKLTGLILGATAVNLPLGYLRCAHERFSFGWLFYAHISIPIIIYLRIKASLSWQFIPVTVGCAVTGQILGGMYHRRRHPHG